MNIQTHLRCWGLYYPYKRYNFPQYQILWILWETPFEPSMHLGLIEGWYLPQNLSYISLLHHILKQTSQGLYLLYNSRLSILRKQRYLHLLTWGILLRLGSPLVNHNPQNKGNLHEKSLPIFQDAPKGL